MSTGNSIAVVGVVVVVTVIATESSSIARHKIGRLTGTAAIAIAIV